LVKLWREDLAKSHPVASQKIADPMEHLDQFDDLTTCEKIEKFIYQKRKGISVPSHQFNDINALLSQDFFSMLKEDANADLSLIDLVPEIQKENPLIEKMMQDFSPAQAEAGVEAGVDAGVEAGVDDI